MQMNKKALVGLLILLVILVPLVWLLSTYHVVEFTLYPKSTTELDLRGQEISVTHYEKLREKLPNAAIRWDVPFQGSVLAEETTELTVSELTVEDAQILARFLPRLRKVNAEGCKDYDALLVLKQQRPAMQVKYRVGLNGKNFASTSVQVTLGGITEEEIGMLRYLPALDAVTVTGGEPEQLKQLRTYCEEAQLRFRMQIGGEIIAEDTSAATLTGVTGEELNLLQLLPNLKKLHLVEPKADARSVIGLQETLPGVAVTWEKSILGKFYSQDAVEIDLTDMISLGEGEKLGDKTAYQYGLELPVQGTQEEVATAIKISKYHPLPDKTDVTRDLLAQVEEHDRLAHAVDINLIAGRKLLALLDSALQITIPMFLCDFDGLGHAFTFGFAVIQKITVSFADFFQCFCVGFVYELCALFNPPFGPCPGTNYGVVHTVFLSQFPVGGIRGDVFCFDFQPVFHACPSHQAFTP